MPVIAITPAWDDEKNRIMINNDYLDAVIRAGGSPVLMPLTDSEDVARSIIQKADALLLSGGSDVSPHLYNEEKLPVCGETAPLRDLQEAWHIRYAMERKLPILGICRGMQIMNCLMGGSLYQDIATQYKPDLKHPCYDTPRDCVHTVEVKEGSLLREALGLDAVPVNSRHHQAVKALGRDLKATAFAPDGTIEAMEFTNGYPMICVQWHPESLEDRFLPQRGIFNWLIKEASR
ncbi:MAG: gamma-glutamyl-gamma-aminobutyrate hydrolase family protein [Clostridia bacterium]|nr:gamma-glutamyl-gamma-aminobutyrate hydrolase family protein [Clostridia bacterium]